MFTSMFTNITDSKILNNLKYIYYLYFSVRINNKYIMNEMRCNTLTSKMFFMCSLYF